MKQLPYTKLFPEGSDRAAVAVLQKLVKSLANEIAVVETKMRHPILKLVPKNRVVLAEILVDFLLDIESGSGIWTALETYNQKLFGTPLPLVHPVGVPLATGFCAERLRFLLWNIYPRFKSGLLISQNHIDLHCAVNELLPHLEKILPQLPKKSPVKTFLDTSNDYGWEVKKKLIWLGAHSFMFRLQFSEYIDAECDDAENIIHHIDDFICQETTSWSGLGVTDILAEILDISAEQKDELRNWSQRHFSLYKFVSISKETARVINLVSNVEYAIRLASPSKPTMAPFRVGDIAFGHLVPWRGEWYWSGQQYDFTQYSPKDIQETLRGLKQNTHVVCRYWKEREAMVRKRFKEIYDAMIIHYGNDLRVFPSGRAWEREEIRLLQTIMKKAGRQGQMPRLPVPEEMLQCDSGIAVYINAEEGMEMIDDFNSIISGLKKNEGGLSPTESEGIHDLIHSEDISPAFVYRVVKEYGGVESIKDAFCIKTNEPYFLDYLLRCYKGHFYRPRFPSLSFVENDDDDDDES